MEAVGRGPPPGLAGFKCRPTVPEADFFHSEKELSHLAEEETLDKVCLEAVLCYCSNKSCHCTSNSPMHVSLKCISCDSVEKSCFLWQHLYVADTLLDFNQPGD